MIDVDYIIEKQFKKAMSHLKTVNIYMNRRCKKMFDFEKMEGIRIKLETAYTKIMKEEGVLKDEN